LYRVNENLLLLAILNSSYWYSATDCSQEYHIDVLNRGGRFTICEKKV